MSSDANQSASGVVKWGVWLLASNFATDTICDQPYFTRMNQWDEASSTNCINFMHIVVQCSTWSHNRWDVATQRQPANIKCVNRPAATQPSSTPTRKLMLVKVIFSDISSA